MDPMRMTRVLRIGKERLSGKGIRSAEKPVAHLAFAVATAVRGVRCAPRSVIG